MNTENSKMSEPHKFVLNLSEKLDLQSSKKNLFFKLVYLLHLEKYKTKLKTIHKLKIIATTWNGEFELSDGSYSV